MIPYLTRSLVVVAGGTANGLVSSFQRADVKFELESWSGPEFQGEVLDRRLLVRNKSLLLALRTRKTMSLITDHRARINLWNG